MKKENAYLKWEIEQAKQQFDLMVQMYGPDSYKAAHARGYLAALENVEEVMRQIEDEMPF